MPCYEVKLMTVEFKAKNLDALKLSLKELNISFSERNGVISFSNFKIDTNNETVSAPYGQENKINQIKMKYSEKILWQVAEKKKWLFKKLQNNKFQMTKW